MGAATNKGGENVSKTTEILDEAGSAVAVPHKDTKLTSGGRDFAHVSQTLTVAEFLARPVPVASGVYNTSITAQSVISTGNIWSNYVACTMWRNKTSGFRNFRGTAVLRLVINAMPFQAGILMLKILPGDDAAKAMRTASAYQFSQLPGAVFSLKQTSALVKVPYRNPNYYTLNKPDTSNWALTQGWGYWYLYAYTALRTAATSDNAAAWTLFLSFEDVELEMPYAPQMGVVGAPRSAKNTRNIIRHTNLRTTIPSEEESRLSAKGGPVSEVLGHVSGITDVLGRIPVLDTVMGNVGWFTRWLQSAASNFGWSRPLVTTDIRRVLTNPFAYGAVATNAVASEPIGLLADHSLAPINDLGYTNEDELSIDFIKRRWSYFTTFTWSSTQTDPSVALIGLPLCPGAMKSSGNTGATTGVVTSLSYADFTTVGFLCQLFKYCRGGLEVRLRISKTEYHSGRLLVVFSPDAPATYNDTTYMFREIVDLREGDEFTFVIPYPFQTPWTDCSNAYGYLSVFPQTDLAYAPTVLNTVDIIVEVRGANNFMLSLPQPHTLIPLSPQMDSRLNDDTEIIDDSGIGGAQQTPLDDEPQYTTGEVASSLSQLCKRFTSCYLYKIANNPTVNQGYIWPFATGGLRLAGSIVFCGPMFGDELSLVTSLYAHWRSSIRVRFVSNTANDIFVTRLAYSDSALSSTTGTSLPLVSTFNNSSSIAATLSSKYLVGAATCQFPTTNNGGFEVSVPAYMQSRYVWYRLADGTYGDSPAQRVENQQAILLWNTLSGSSTGYGVMYRAAGDDLQCGLFLCVPRMFTGSP